MSVEPVRDRKRSCVVGIDVGLDGAICALLAGVLIPVLFEMPTNTVTTGTKKKPTKKRVLNGPKLRSIFLSIMERAEDIYVMIERPQLRPALRRDAVSGQLVVNQGIASQAGFMEQFGLIRGILIGLGIAYEDCHPNTWKADMFHGASDKTDARRLAQQLFPIIAQRFELKKNDGLAEATLLAEYARRRHAAPF